MAKFFVGQLLIFILVLLTLLLPFDKLYKISQKSVITNWMFCFLSIIYLAYYFKAKFNPLEFIKDADIMIATMVIFTTFFWKIDSLYKLMQYEKELKMHKDYARIMQTYMDSFLKRVHKVDNVLSSINGSLVMTTNLEDLRKEIRQYTSMIEIDEDMKDILTADNKYIVTFISAKKQQAKENEIDIITDIEYRKKCQLISEHIIIVDLLGELLDNAIQNSNKGTVIRVRMQIDELKMHLEVENEHEWISVKEKKKIFKKGFTTNTGQLKV
jgi:sensor histidine kinase regulating citrate/malate metabolism